MNIPIVLNRPLMKNLVVFLYLICLAVPATAFSKAFAISFTNGSNALLSTCRNSGVSSLNSLLTVNDNTTGQPLTWTVVSGPSHGTLSGFPAASVTNGSSVTPSGTGYQPAAGYAGGDSFIIEASDGISSAQITISVNVGAAPALPVFTQYQTVVNQGQMGVVYSVLADPMGTSYNWIYLGSGVTINSNNTETMTMDFGSSATSGTLYVQITGPCGNSPYQQLNITVTTMPMPVKLISFTVAPVHDDALVEWTTSAEENSHHFNIQRSEDGHRFYTIHQIPAAGNASHVINYQFLDTSLRTQRAYYRLLQVDIDGKAYGSAIRTLDRKADRSQLLVYPNPFSANELNIKKDPLKKGAYELLLFNVSGQVVFSQKGRYGGESIMKLQLPVLQKGAYVLQMKDASGSISQRLIRN